ncbi:MAG: hypothetical protein J6Q44_01885 [Alphaproteobacteria bacterium]|nr:hypothetical protein [Alphaproteobacteria bacterium]
MSKVQKDKYDILAEVALALRVQNQKVNIETLDAKDAGYGMVYDNLPHIPTSRTKNAFNGIASLSRLHAKSIKIGEDISIKRIHRKPTIVKTEKQEYEVDNGWYYLVRTPQGEAKFASNDWDFLMVWNYALAMHDGTDRYMSFVKNLRNEKVEKAAGQPMIMQEPDANKYKDAIKKLKTMGIEPKKLMHYLKEKGKEI